MGSKNISMSSLSNNGTEFHNPSSLIGRMYELRVEHGSHLTYLIGKIEAIQFSDEVGLELYVSNPELWGASLRSLVHDKDDHWVVRTTEPEERHSGQIIFLT